MSNAYIPDWSEVLAVSHSRGADSDDPRAWSDLRGGWLGLQGGGKKWFDVSGFGNRGTLTNMVPATAWVASALDFGGASQERVSVAAAASINDLVPLSISTWCFPRDIEINAALVDKRGQFFALGWQFYIQGAFADSGKLAFRRDSGGGTDMWGTTANGAVAVNQWQHLAMTWDGGLDPSTSVQFFVNGQEQSLSLSTVGSVGSSDAGNALSIGGQPWSPGSSVDELDGLLATTTVHNRILASSEIQQLFADPDAMFRPRAKVYAAAVAAVGIGGSPMRMESPLYGAL